LNKRRESIHRTGAIALLELARQGYHPIDRQHTVRGGLSAPNKAAGNILTTVLFSYWAGALTKIIVIREPDSPVPAMRTKTFSPREKAVNIVASPPFPRVELR
jgi:hypothetical protein